MGGLNVRWLLMPVAIAAGSLMVVQAACNSALERAWERPVTVGAISLSIGISVLVVVGFAFGQLGLPSGKAAQAPWWAWLGGLCGALSLLSQPLAAPRLGAATYVGLFVTASSIASVIADHFGWLGFDQHAAGLGRVAGCALMVTGIVLVSLC
jgi:bacterial/archaeal transporter family-2 protein